MAQCWFWSTHFDLSSFLNPSIVTSVFDRLKILVESKFFQSKKSLYSPLSTSFFYQNRPFKKRLETFWPSFLARMHGIYFFELWFDLRLPPKSLPHFKIIQNNHKQGAYWSFKFTLFDRLVVTIPRSISPFHHKY